MIMTDHEEIMVCAERYALGRRTYVVSDTVKYIARHIPEMTEHCRNVLIRDIENPLFGSDSYGDDCDKKNWMWLLDRLKETQNSEDTKESNAEEI